LKTSTNQAFIPFDRDRRFRIVTDDSGLCPKSVTFVRNLRSPSSGIAGHVRPEYAVTLVRNTHTALGISLGNASNSVLAGNRIGSLTAPSGATYGIYLYSSSDSIVRDNSLSGMQYGIIFQGTGKYMNNMTQGVGMPYTGGTAAGATNY
jgi:parallel beta-helix repeat protein